MIKIKHGKHELISIDPLQLYHAALAYVHAMIRFLISETSKYEDAGLEHLMDN